MGEKPIIPEQVYGGRKLFRIFQTRFTGTTTFAFLVIICLWAVMALLVNPIGNFPLNDDWVYGQAASHLVEKGEFRFIAWTDVSLIAQVFWGALFCLPFGFSFAALRLSTLTIGLIGTLTTHALLKEAGAKPSIALFGALLVVTNPLYFQLSNTFMTDVPFFTVAMLSLLLLVRGISRERTLELVVGIVFACIAALIRQFGVVIPFAFTLAYLEKNGINKKSVAMAIGSIALVSGVLIVYQAWIQPMLGLPSVLQVVSRRFPIAITTLIYQVGKTCIKWGIITGLYLGLFLLPWLILLLPREWRTIPPRTRVLCVVSFIALFASMVGVLVWKNQLMPLTGNILFDIGLGPVLLRDVDIMQLSHLPKAPRLFWLVITAGSVVGVLLLCWSVFVSLRQIYYRYKQIHSLANEWFPVFFIAACVLYFLPLGMASAFFDRYLFFFFTPLMIVVLSSQSLRLSPGRLSSSLAVALLGIYGVFAVGATHDFLSLNKARWQALNDLTQRKQISYRQIDGGYEFNGWYGYDSRHDTEADLSNIDPKLWSRMKSWWWVKDDEYIISCGPIPGYQDIQRYPYTQWIPFGQRNIWVLHREEITTQNSVQK